MCFPSSMPVEVIIPAFDEEENVRILIPRVFAAFSEHSITGLVTIVDDSPSGATAKAAQELQRTFSALTVIRLEQRVGLARAVLAGFRASQAEILGVMDADLSHPPELIPRLLDALASANADLAIASRYCPGGAIQRWPARRKLMSRLARWLVRVLVRNVADPLSGFFVIRRSALEDVTLNPRGYKIGLELLVKAHIAIVVEVPYTFVDRQRGNSKLTLRECMVFLRHVLSLLMFRLLSGETGRTH